MSSLGEKLRQAREARGVSLGEVAEQTRISTHYLEAIESDDYRNLPGGIFNKGFVKAFAKYVGIDEQEALQDYSKIISEQGDKLNEPELKFNRPEVLTDDSVGRSSMLPTIIFAAVILGLMTWGILAAINWYQKQEEDKRVVNQPKPNPPSPLANAVSSANNNTNATANADSGNINTNANINSNGTNPTETAPVAPGEIAIQFKSSSTETEKPNLTATIDGKYESYTFQADEPKVYNPQQSIKIVFSRFQTRFLQMTINGKPITLPEKPFRKGDAVSFVIDKNNIGKVLQAGALTPESLGLDATGKPIPVANANTATPATTMPKQ